MTKDLAAVSPIPQQDPPQEPKKPHVDNGKPIDDTPEELSEEDLQMKNELELCVQRLKEPNDALYRASLESLRTIIRTSTSSMTSVPKPLKFLRPHYPALKAVYETWPESGDKAFLADVLSVLGMTYSEDGKRESLKFRMLGTSEAAGDWGHEYVRHLAAEIGEEYNARITAEPPVATDDIVALALQITPFFLQHNAEADAVDLLLELEAIDQIVPHVDENTFARVGLYMVSCVPYLPYPEDETVLRAAHAIYRQVKRLPEALIMAMRLDDKALIQQDYDACEDPIQKKQLAFMLARQTVSVEAQDETEQEILANGKLSESFLALGAELGIMDPKTPEDIYKTHLETRGTMADSARLNLASTMVNAFVNAGFGKDTLMLVDDSKWIYKNKDHAMLAATASLGMLQLWDVETGLTQIDKYLYSNEEYVKAGAVLAIGMVTANVKNESDPAMALLSEHLTEGPLSVRLAAITGLGMAYAGSGRQEIADMLTPLLEDGGEVSCTAALALGMIMVGTCDGDLSSTILTLLMESPAVHAKSRFMGLGLALLYLGKQEACEATLETLKAIEAPISKSFQVLLEIAAYAGTGNVLKVQAMTRLCSDHLKENDEWQAYTVLGIALIAMGEDIGNEMALRTFNHFMHYGEPVVRKAVPLGIALLCASNPQVHVLDILSKYSHDHDQDVAVNAIFAMGLVGAGTNNARLAQMLRQLASYYAKDPNCLFMVRIAQGLIHLGKGTMTINPYHTNRTLMSRVGVAGLLTVLVAMTDAKHLVLGKSHWLLYHLVSAMYPRFLITLDENLKTKSVSVRVGQAVDVVGQAGRPKTITGFQTHNTPVLMAYGERAELATDEYVPLAPVIEGLVIVKKNPELMETDKE
ncbi:hypothetical protein AMAG_02978 [Allomyces macrogynus ATCC 38327]|uniref:26S proteasome regulatory subunit RPN1 n=1 Tax=Allomyces macrogynus (strain ATCC 38327) TaxID=578462 RepID=A0A0L0S479_ALLM3|nr:hypothetical protein AMAG_02978 [Allomyces macrogynus ATCC 38327]|eukprot:KNE57245.1 hypothetical protein AMAG_02978 [Allomyces macrogynus ATCC 38327]